MHLFALAPAAARRAMLAILALLLSGVIIGALAVSSAIAAESVPVRAADHGDFGRIVFDWKQPVGHSIEVSGHELTVTFDRGMEGSLKPLLHQLGDYIAAAHLEDEGRKAVFALKGDFVASDFDSGASVAIDLKRGLASAARPQTAKTVTVRGGSHDDFGRIVFDWAGPVDYKASEQTNKLKLSFASAAKLDLDKIRADLPPFVTAIESSEEGKGTAVTISGVDAARFRHFRSETKVVVDVLPPGASPGQADSKDQAAAREHAMVPASGPDSAAPPNPPATPSGSGSSGAPQSDHPPVVHRAMVAEVTGEELPPPAPANTGTAGAPTRLLPDKSAPQSTPAQTSPAQAAPVQNSPAQNLPAQKLPVGQNPAPAGPSAKMALPPAIGTSAALSPSAQSLTADLAPAAKPDAPAVKPDAPALKPDAPVAKAAPALPAPQQPAASQVAVKQTAPQPTPSAAATPARQTAKAEPTPQTAKAEPAKPGSATPESVKAEPAKIETAPAQPVPTIAVAAKVEKGTLVLGFNWGDPVAVAVYRRAENLWIVFDRKAKLDLSALESWRKEITAAAVDAPDATALRLTVGNAFTAAVRREGTMVGLALSEAPVHPAAALSPETDADSGSRMLIPVKDARQPVLLTDPDVGDRIFVVPVMAAEAVATAREFALFRVPTTTQGVVIEPKADGVAVQTIADGVEVTSAAGLFLSTKNGPLPDTTPARDTPVPESAQPPAAVAVAPDPKPGRIFDFPTWGRGDVAYDDTRIALQHAIISAPPSQRTPARLDLARFYFARGAYADSMGLLGVIAADNPEAATTASFLAVRGATRFLMDDYAAAAADLGAQVLANEPEAELWRGALAAAQANWPAAVASFSQVGDRIQDYPPSLKVKFGLLAAETAVESHEFDAAKTYADFVEQAGPDASAKSAVTYLRGRLAASKRQTDDAAKLYDEAAAGGDPAVTAKAKFAKVAMLLDAKKMSSEDAIAALEQLRFAWRGDSFEFDVLRRLGDLYISTGHYEKGLTTLKRAVTFFPDDPRSKDAAEAMNATFAKLYVDGSADKMPPLQALGLYQDFRELTPPGPAGDTVIRKLAERMVAIDLLDQAGDLLEPLVDARLQGDEKAEAGTRLAVIRLLDKKPDKAIAALTASSVPGISRELAAERRRIEAQALADQDKVTDAMAALNGDTTHEADLLRTDILWRQHNWAEAAKVLARLTDNAGAGKTGADKSAANKSSADGSDGSGAVKPSDEQAQLLLKRAAALWLADERDALDNLRETYGPAMEKTPFGNDFRVISAGTAGEIDSVEAVTARLADIKAYAAFAADLKSGTAKSQPETAKDAPKEVAAAPK